jgi:hypothetical protein
MNVGDTVVVIRDVLVITGSDITLPPGSAGVVVDVNKDDGGLLVRFDPLPDPIGAHAEDLSRR